MEKQEMLMLSGKERDRLKVLHGVQEGHLTQGEAAGQLGISDREVRRLLARIAAEGIAEWCIGCAERCRTGVYRRVYAPARGS
jgi:DNA-binding transcriptional regulator LsrR (DeoR family)